MFFRSDCGKVKVLVRKIRDINKIIQTPYNSDKIEIKTKEYYKTLSDILFKALKNRNYKVMELVIKSNFVAADMVFNSKGLNMVQYSILESDNELFKILYYKYYKYIASYFNSTPSYFIFLLNKKNYDLIKIFLTENVLYNKLEKANISVCFYSAIQNDVDFLIDLILGNPTLESQLDGKDIQSLLIYSISHEQCDKLKKVFFYDILVDKCSNEHLQNLVALSLINKNIEALSVMMDNEKILNFILSDRNVFTNISLFAYSSNNLKLMSLIVKNKDKLPPIEVVVENTSKKLFIEDSI